MTPTRLAFLYYNKVGAGNKILLTVAQRRLLVLDLQTGLGKEGSNQLGPLPEAADREDQLLVQLLQVPTHQVGHLHVFEVMPTPLVPRVQVRGVTRQGLQPDLAARLGYELRDLGSTVDRRAIPDHQQP